MARLTQCDKCKRVLLNQEQAWTVVVEPLRIPRPHTPLPPEIDMQLCGPCYRTLAEYLNGVSILVK